MSMVSHRARTSALGAGLQQVPVPDLIHWCEEQYTHTLKNYAAFHAWVVENPADFLAVMEGFCDAKDVLAVAEKGGESPRAAFHCGERQDEKKLSTRREKLAMQFIVENLDKSVSVEEMARCCGLSRSYFTHVFKRATGMSPHYFQTHLRIEKAKDLLIKERNSICEIATKCGFSDQSHFSRVFSQTVGVSPGAWRMEQCACV